MKFIWPKGFGSVGSWIVLITPALSATVDHEYPLSICRSESESPLNRRQGSGYGLDNSDLISAIGSTRGCPTTREIAYIGLVTDCTYTSGFDSADSAGEYIQSFVNTASVVFENSFNISLMIRNLSISDAECPNGGSSDADWNAPCSAGDMNWRLNRFSSWRASLYDDNAYWTLLTGCSSGDQVGVSWIGSLCNSGSQFGSSGVSTNVVARTQNDWEVFA